MRLIDLSRSGAVPQAGGVNLSLTMKNNRGSYNKSC